MAPEKSQKIPDANLFRCKTLIDIRWRDLDPMGHVNNAVYMTYFEMARVAYWQVIADGQKIKFPFILASAAVTYLAPARMEDRLVAHIRVSHIGAKSFEFEYLVTKEADDAAVATGVSTQVCYDYEKKKSINVPAELRQRIEGYEGHKKTFYVSSTKNNEENVRNRKKHDSNLKTS